MTRPRSEFLAGLVLILFATPTAGDVVLFSILEDLEAVDRSKGLTVTRSGRFEAEEAHVGMPLGVGDELSGTTKVLTIELKCGDDVSIGFVAPFRVVILPKSNAGSACAFNILGGDAEVVEKEPTECVAGEVTLGAEHTRYGVSVRRTNGKPETSVLVYDGVVKVRASADTEHAQVRNGQKMMFHGQQRKAGRLTPGEFNRAARVYARVDLGGGKIAPDFRLKAYTALQEQYEQLLREPSNRRRSLDLAFVQLSYHLPRRAVCTLDQADLRYPQDSAMTALMRAEAAAQLGDADRARALHANALTIDRSVAEAGILAAYKIDPAAGQQIGYLQSIINPKSLITQVSLSPQTVKPRQPTTITVRVYGSDRKPVGGAQVSIRAGGGVFDITRNNEAKGTTNEEGLFQARWQCVNCASSYVLGIEVSKPGLETIHKEATVTVTP